MKKIFFFLCLFFSIATNAQELCGNGIDDDGDGLIDLNDTADCKCHGLGIGLPSSLIKNPSFEEYTSCPTTYSQLDRCKDWIQATAATSDYQNTCGWSWPTMGAGIIPPPDGIGWVGALMSTTYKEYVGSCLTAPLLTSKSYKLKFHIATQASSGAPTLCDPFDITVFGANLCSDLPISGFAWDCPSAMSAAWKELGNVTYTPSLLWNSQEIVFTPTVEINSIILGPPCLVPSCYSAMVYLHFDNLIINESALFEPAKIVKTGHYCNNDLILSSVLSSVPSATATYQWYKNGIALSGATSTTYTVPGGLSGVGSYQVMITDAGDCSLSTQYNITVDPPPVLIVSATPTLICEGKISDLQVSGADTYTWSSGATSFSTSVSPLVTTVYTVSGVDSIGCKSIESVTVQVINPKITVNSPTICLGQSATLNATGLNTYTWSVGSFDNTITITPSVTTSYSVEGTDLYGCKTSETTTVDVINTIADFEGFDKSIYEFGTSIDLVNKSSDAIDYQWIYCNGAVSTNTNLTITLQDSGNCCMKLVAKKLQCTDTISKCFYVKPESYIVIPNVFTPNGDGTNEVFRIKTFGIVDLQCIILDRWGLKLYEWDGINGYWDGMAKSGPAPSGTYYYIIRYSNIKGVEKTEKGFLTLFKD